MTTSFRPPERRDVDALMGGVVTDAGSEGSGAGYRDAVEYVLISGTVGLGEVRGQVRAGVSA